MTCHWMLWASQILNSSMTCHDLLIESQISNYDHTEWHVTECCTLLGHTESHKSNFYEVKPYESYNVQVKMLLQEQWLHGVERLSWKEDRQRCGRRHIDLIQGTTGIFLHKLRQLQPHTFFCIIHIQFILTFHEI